MNLSMRWLSDYVTVESTIEEYIRDMTMSGTKVESYKKENDSIRNIVVGKVLEITKHPDADKLVVCQIDIGKKEPVQIVTGATNVTVGSLVPTALDKSLLPNGLKINKGELRGVTSHGMLCSLEELNLTHGDFPYADEEGIFLLEEDCKPGDPIEEALGLNDTIVDFEITSNRPDCLGVLGLARETAATYGKKFTPSIPQVKGGGTPIKELISLEVENTALCTRYMAAVVENVKIGPSPRWIRERLRASGIRSINNIVDITNFVMLEYGHPMHAFDSRHVEDRKIIVRNAKKGEKITTLDGVQRSLSPEMLVIADGKSATAVAGIMGGEYSSIYEDTQTVIFEAACFDSASIRHTGKSLGLRTESSGRFEKGLDSENCENAIKRACQLVELLEVGTVGQGFLDVHTNPYVGKDLTFEPDWINQLVGVEIPEQEMVEILDNLGFSVENKNVQIPSFRGGDMHVGNDIAEEVIRIYGYDKIPTTVLVGESKGLVTHEQRFRKEIANTLVTQGYSEIMTYSFFSPKNYDKLGFPENSPQRESVIIRNPLGEDTSYLRTTAAPSMLNTLSYNYNNRNGEARLYEVATTYLPKEAGLPEEPLWVLLGEYGENTDFFTIKGGVEALLDSFGIVKREFVLVTDNPTYHPGRCANLFINGEIAGTLGEVHPTVGENFEIKTRVYMAELDYSVLYANRVKDFVFRPLPKFPASTRDLALVSLADLPVGEMEKAIRKGVGSILEEIHLFDVYQGDQIEKGKKSVAFALTFRGEDRTLTDKESDKAVELALDELKKIGATLRE